MMNWLLGVVLALLVLVALGWAGLQVPPAPFPPVAEAPGEVATVPLPEGLPAPVARFYREAYSGELPVYDSVVLAGRARLRIMGVTLPAR
jgi:hypothetical protein